MKPILIVLSFGLVGLGGPAYAGRVPLVSPPAGWRASAEQAEALAARANAVSHFGVRRSVATADVFVAPRPGVALFVTGVSAKVSAVDRDAAARVAVDELHDATARASLAGTSVVVDRWEEKVVTDLKAVTASVQWRDTGSGTQTNATIVIVAGSEHVVAVTGECVAGPDATAKDRADCVAALSTLDPGVVPDQRVELALAAEGVTPTEGGLPQPMTSRPLPATMSDGTRAPLPPIAIPQQTTAADRRPVYVGLGLVVLAAIFWWNQRRRARFEHGEDSDE